MAHRDNEPPQVFLNAAGGDHEAMNAATSAVYEALRKMAYAEASRMRDGAFQPTALVHETYMRLQKQRSGGWTDERSFLQVAARVMRRVLVDDARARLRLKRGDDRPADSLEELQLAIEDRRLGVLDMNDLLESLAQVAEPQAHVAELIVFGGLTIDETADTLGISPRSVDRQWRLARAWFERELQSGDQE